MNLLSVNEAAARLGVTPGRVRQLVASGRLPARKLGSQNVITEEALALFQRAPYAYMPKSGREVSITQAAAILNLSRQRVARLVKQGRLPIAYRTPYIMLDRGAVIAFRDSRRATEATDSS